MKSHQIVAAFSDIKVELRTKAGIEKPLSEIRLWFTVDEGAVYAHDDVDHGKCIFLAVLRSHDEDWSHHLKKGTYGRQLIEDLTLEFGIHELADVLNGLWDSHGH